MENLRKEYVLGVKENEIVIGEFEVTTRNGYKEFTASFDVGEAFDIEDIDEKYIEEYNEEYWGSIDDSTKLDLLQDGYRTKWEVFEDWELTPDDYREIKDCSCTDIEVELEDGTTINFESTCGGQHDIRKDENFNKMKYTNKKAVLLLLKLWDKYHLKNIENLPEVEKDIETIIKLLDNFTIYDDETEKFIIENIEID